MSAQSCSSGAGNGVSGPAPRRLPGLPAVHDLALVPEVLRVEDSPLAHQQVLPLREELVVGRDHPGPQPPVGEVDQVGGGEVDSVGPVVAVRVTARVRRGIVGVRVVGVGVLAVRGGGVCGHGSTVTGAECSRPSKLSDGNVRVG